MLLVQIRLGSLLLVVLLFLYSGVDSKCEDSNHEFEGSSKNQLSYQNELEQIFDTFDKNDIQKMEEMLAFLKDQGMDEINDQTINSVNDPLRFVVSMWWE